MPRYPSTRSTRVVQSINCLRARYCLHEEVSQSHTHNFIFVMGL